MGYGLPVKFTPLSLRICHMFWWGRNATEIAAHFRLTTSQVQHILATPECKEIIELMKRNVITSMLEVSSAIQAIAPAILEEKARLALECDDPRVRDRACNDLLQWAIGTPTKRVEIRTAPQTEAHEDMSEEDIREELRKRVGLIAGDLGPNRVLN
jgi:adenosine deaminase